MFSECGNPGIVVAQDLSQHPVVVLANPRNRSGAAGAPLQAETPALDDARSRLGTLDLGIDSSITRYGESGMDTPLCGYAGYGVYSMKRADICR